VGELMSEPAVSVIIPVLNEERFLKQSVEAILNQNYSGQLEIILALGPSKDQTNVIAQELAKDQRIKLVENPVLDEFLTFDVNYNIPLDIIYNEEIQSHSIESSEFTYKGLRSIIRDNGNGIINVVSASDSAIIDPIGTINYTSGLLQFSNFKLDSFTGTGIKIYAYPQFKDISTINKRHFNLYSERWFQYEKEHREDGPAVNHWRADGTLYMSIWYQHGKKHRDDEPADIQYYPDGILHLERWYQNGKCHRINELPAVIIYDYEGNIVVNKRYENDVCINVYM